MSIKYFHFYSGKCKLFNFTLQFKTKHEIQKIVQLFDDLQHGECWIGVNMQKVLAGVNAAKAIHKQSVNHNSIWHLVNHLISWRKTVTGQQQGSGRPGGRYQYHQKKK